MWEGTTAGPDGRARHVSGCAHCGTRYERPVINLELPEPETLPLFEVEP